MEESRKLKKIRRKLEVFSHRADIVPIAREIFCGRDAEAAANSHVSEIPKVRVRWTWLKDFLESPLFWGAIGLIAGFALSSSSPTVSLLIFAFAWAVLCVGFVRHFFKGLRIVDRAIFLSLVIVITGFGLYLLWSNLVEGDIKAALTGSVELPAPTDVLHTSFTLTNGSRAVVSYTYYCGIHLIVSEDGGAVGSLSAAVSPWRGVMNPGDPSSTPCLAGFRTMRPVACADVEFWAKYHIPYILKTQRKYFRFVGYRDAGTFVWAPEAPAGPGWRPEEDDKYCGKYLPKAQ